MAKKIRNPKPRLSRSSKGRPEKLAQKKLQPKTRAGSKQEKVLVPCDDPRG